MSAGETKNLRIRDVPEEYAQLWNHLKADLGSDVSHLEALKHILDVYEEYPELLTDGDPSDVDVVSFR